MIPKHEIKRRYALMAWTYGEDSQSVVICYACTRCGHTTKTLTVAQGITPIKHDCENCGQLAGRAGIADPVPERPHTQEWHRPELSELLKSDDARYVEQVLHGVLFNKVLIKHNSDYISKQFK